MSSKDVEVIKEKSTVFLVTCCRPGCLLNSRLVHLVIVVKLEHARADLNLVTHDNAFRDTTDTVFTALDSRVVKVISGHLETSKHESRLLHLGHAESGDTVDLSLESHLVSQQLNVSVVNVHTI